MRVSCSKWSPYIDWCPAGSGALLKSFGHGISLDLALEFAHSFLKEDSVHLYGGDDSTLKSNRTHWPYIAAIIDNLTDASVTFAAYTEKRGEDFDFIAHKFLSVEWVFVMNPKFVPYSFSLFRPYSPWLWIILALFWMLLFSLTLYKSKSKSVAVVYDTTFQIGNMTKFFPGIVIPWLFVSLILIEGYKAQVIKSLQPLHAPIRSEDLARLIERADLRLLEIGGAAKRMVENHWALGRALKINPPVNLKNHVDATNLLVKTNGTVRAVDLVTAINLKNRYPFLRILRDPEYGLWACSFAMVRKGRSDELVKKLQTASAHFLENGILKKIARSYFVEIEKKYEAQTNDDSTPVMLSQLKGIFEVLMLCFGVSILCLLSEISWSSVYIVYITYTIKTFLRN